jgi:soluble lytic murein transglycosylase-like protein
VQKYGGVPPYAETQRYVQRVGQLAERYRGAVASR